MMMNEVNLNGLYDAKWFAIVTPMALGTPGLRSGVDYHDDRRGHHRFY